MTLPTDVWTVSTITAPGAMFGRSQTTFGVSDEQVTTGVAGAKLTLVAVKPAGACR